MAKEKITKRNPPHQAGLRLLCVTRQLGTGNRRSSTAWFSGLVIWFNLGPQNPQLHDLKSLIWAGE